MTFLSSPHVSQQIPFLLVFLLQSILEATSGLLYETVEMGAQNQLLRENFL